MSSVEKCKSTPLEVTKPPRPLPMGTKVLLTLLTPTITIPCPLPAGC